MHNKYKIIILAALAVLSAALFISYDLGYWQYTLPRRIEKVAAIVLTGGAIAFSSVIFQTITNNQNLNS